MAAVIALALNFARLEFDGRIATKVHRSVYIINECAPSKLATLSSSNDAQLSSFTLKPNDKSNITSSNESNFNKSKSYSESKKRPFQLPATTIPSSGTSFLVEPGKKNLAGKDKSRPHVSVTDNRSSQTNSLHQRSINSSSPSSKSSSWVNLRCLKHAKITVNASHVMGRAFALLDMTMREGCGPLRRDWRNNPPLSPMARTILQHQSNCSLPTVTWKMDNSFGIGSHVAQWSQAMCYAWERNLRLRSYNPIWLWMDQIHCNKSDAAQRSPWLCYLPDVELLCEQTVKGNLTMVDPRFQKHDCWHKKQPGFVPAFRAASIEYMFRSVSPLVLQEARRQVGVLFGPQGAPKDLITVHVRWGDKSAEMKLLGIQDYINATSHILQHQLGRRNSGTANIYLATEDPAAAHAFASAAPKSWKIYRDVSIDELSRFRPSTRYNSASWMSINTLGRGGLLNMASMLVALEANYFVLTTASSFSRIINSIRTNILDPRCNNCTRMIDLQSGMW
jgi:hypothetical protein